MRASWRALLTTAILCGLFGGAVLAMFAGARRTEAAYPDFLDRQHAMDVILLDQALFAPLFWKPDFERLKHLPYVEAWAPVVAGGFPSDGFISGTDDRYYNVVDRPVLVKGRLPRPDSTDEIAVPHFADGRFGTFHVGDRQTIDLGRRSVTFTVVGETVVPGELPPQPEFGWTIALSPAFIKRYQGDLNFALPALALRFKHRSDIALFERDVRAMTGGKIVAPIEQESHTRAVQGSADLQASALRLLGLFIAITAVLIIGQALMRETMLASDDLPILRALGLTRGQLFRLGLVRVSPIAVGAAVLSTTTAWLASPIFPRGSVRIADAPAGLRFDVFVLGIGALAAAALTMLLAVWPAWRASRSIDVVDKAPARPSAIASFLSRTGAPAPAVAGARLALERGGGRTAVPIVSSLIVVSLGVASFVAAGTFASSLQTMIDHPAVYGKTWNGVINIGFSQAHTPEQIVAAIGEEPNVEALAFADSGAPVRLFAGEQGHGPARGIGVAGFYVHNVKGSLFPPIVEGRAPRTPDEIVLGARMIRALGLRFDPAHPPTVRLQLEGAGKATVTLRVVGRAVIPPLGNFGQFGYGLSWSDRRTVAPLVAAFGGVPAVSDLIVRWRPGADRKAVVARVHARFPEVILGTDLASGKLADVVNFGGVQSAPTVVGGVLAALGLAGLAHVLVTAVRRRRRDIAILKTIGFVRGQARRTVAWQATITAFIAGIIGIPVGIAVGRWLWSLVANGLGVLPVPRTPVLIYVLLPPALIVLANMIAVLPGRSAARTRPAMVLRTE